MGPIIHDPELSGRRGVFQDRAAAGTVCADLLQRHEELVSNALCGAIPSGGVAVAGPITRRLGLPFTLLVARKVQVPGNPESGMGAVAWDGRVLLDRPLIAALSFEPVEVEEAVRRARASVEERLARFFGPKSMPDVRGRRVLVVDDGLAGGSTALVVVAALRGAGAGPIVVVVPTGHERTVGLVAEAADAVVCANIRPGGRFAVAEAYRHWRDLEEHEVLTLLKQLEDEGLF